MSDNWSVPLREHVEARIVALEKATEVATKAMDVRLAGMNEFRDTLKDQAAKFITRSEVETLLRPICEDVRNLRKLADQAEGKASWNSVLLAGIGAIIGIVIGLVRIFGK